jgi:hypothetical protein
MPIVYSATTEGATFLLDELGVCRHVLLKPVAHGEYTMGGRTRSEAARVMKGAQYVASIDTSALGGLVPLPKPGAAMLFAYMGEDGRLAVVRTGPLVKFDTLAIPLADDTIEEDIVIEDDETMTVPIHAAHSTWPTPPRQKVRLQKVSVVPPSESAPTLRRVDAPARRGMLPKRAGRM